MNPDSSKIMTTIGLGLMALFAIMMIDKSFDTDMYMDLNYGSKWRVGKVINGVELIGVEAVYSFLIINNVATFDYEGNTYQFTNKSTVNLGDFTFHITMINSDGYIRYEVMD